jgi:transcription elongation factor Elf1
MSDIKFDIKIEGDSEGYVTFGCPFCESEFKLNASEFQDEDNVFTELFCPYCGLTDEINTFYSREVMEQAETIAYNYMIEQVNKIFKDFKNSARGNKYIKIDFKELKKVNLKELKDKDTVEEIFSCPICENHVRVLYCAGVSKVFCAYCGVDI